MNLSSLTSFFFKKNKTLTVPDSILIKKLKNLSTQSNLLVYKDVTIYHHKDSYKVPLMVLDDLRGLYIFETKEWTFDELKNADIQKATEQDASTDTLAFDNTHTIIRKKFNELTHNDGVPIFNYLLMENLNANEYEHLNDSFKMLIPKEKVIFSDSLQSDIFKKLQASSAERKDLPSASSILGTLLVQYAILDNENEISICSNEQKNFIDKELNAYEELTGVSASGKSNLLLLKAIIELLNNTNQKILIIKPTILGCDILKKKLLDIVEHAIIEIDLTSIEILTPLELINQHQNRLGRDKLHSLDIDDKLMNKAFSVADLIMCDDSNFFSFEFISYLKHIQKKSKLVLVNPKRENENFLLNKNFKEETRTLHFHKTNPHAKALHLISSLLNSGETNILVVSNSLSREKLKDDLESFIKNRAKILESNIHLINQEENRLSLCTYKDVNALSANHIILMDLCFTSKDEIEYAFNLSNISVNVLYEEDCQEIKNLRNVYESSKK